MRFVNILVKTLILVAAISGIYYFFFLKPSIKAQKELAQNHANLVQNRLAYVELTRLDPKSASFDIEKSNLVAKLKETNKKGLEDSSTSLATRQIYERQNKLLEKVFATKSYQEGVSVLKSQEAVSLLTDQTNLILEMEFQLEKLKK